MTTFINNRIYGSIPRQCRDEILRRLEMRFEGGCFSMSINDYAEFLLAILPEDFAEPPVDRFISEAAPGSPLRIADYETRKTMRVAVFSFLDPKASGGILPDPRGKTGGDTAPRDPDNPGGWMDRRPCKPIPTPSQQVGSVIRAAAGDRQQTEEEVSESRQLQFDW